MLLAILVPLALLACADGPKDTGPVDDSGDGCPVALVTPEQLTWDELALGQPAVAPVSLVNNCAGEGALSVVAEVSGEGFTVAGTPVSLEPGGVATLEVTVTPTHYEALTGTLVLTMNDPALPTLALPLLAAVDADGDDDGYEATGAGGDDCDDADPAVYPAATETWYDGVDADCDGASDFDQDGDGFDVGTDCDDEDPAVSPAAVEVWYDGIDTDCSGASDFDQDGDGVDLGADCDDEDAAAYPGGPETWYDGIDGDCDGASDFDQDGDGFDLGADCNDEDAAVHPTASDAWYDGVDADCDGASDFDQDGDGFDLGVDCDDEDAAVSPAAIEVWYDGVDADCDGASDFDQDGDGIDRYPEGTDCADTDPASVDGSEEVLNGRDDDCDGQVDEGLVTAGAVVVSEVLADPYSVADIYGEWFEVYNTTDHDLDLNGWTVYSDDGGNFVVSGSVPLPAHGYAVLAVEDDPALNGGVAVDYVYARASFSLGDDGDSIYLQAGDTPISDVVWTSTWPAGLYSGAAQGLDPDHLDATDAREIYYWCTATDDLDGGDRGSPGEANGDCTSLDDDGDGYRTNDCDDNDPSIYPGAAEVLGDGIDQGCDTFADNEAHAPGSLPYLHGGSRDAGLTALGLGDTDGDGGLDLVTVTETGTAYLFDGAGYASWAGSASTHASASFRMTTASPTPSRSWGVGDYTGDGVVDLTLLTASGLTGWAGPFSGTGAPRAPDLTINNFSTIGGLGPSILAGGDYDGDGIDDLLWADPHSMRRYGLDGYVAIYAGGGLTGALTLADADTVLGGGEVGAMLGAVVEIGDVDGDGRDDLAVVSADATASPTYIWTSDGFATADAEIPDVASTIVLTPGNDSGLAYCWMALGDFDADGQADLAHTAYGISGTAANFYLALPGGGATVSTADVTWSEGVRFVDARNDTDGDGHDELALVVDPGDGAPLFHGFLAAGAFDDGSIGADDASWGVSVPDPAGTDFHIGDLDGDGRVELVAWDPEGVVSAPGEGAIQVVPGP